MSTKPFNPNEWLSEGSHPNNRNQPKGHLPVNSERPPEPTRMQGHHSPLQQQIQQKQQHRQHAVQHASNDFEEVEAMICQIERQQLDIASAYEEWRNVGFAFADAFNEAGRELYHRVSRFYSNYSETECNKQYNFCLKAKGQGVTLKTFYYYAHQAGVKLPPPPGVAEKPPLEPPPSMQRQPSLQAGQHAKQPLLQEKQRQEQPLALPTLPGKVHEELPEFLKRVVNVSTSDEERDLLLLGSLVSLSSCFPKLYGIYDGRKVFANLYLFVTAQASAGKGRLIHCKQLVKLVHKEMREQARLLKQQHELEMAEHNSGKSGENGAEKPAKPPEKMLFIPANNSTTGVFQLLSDNEGRGLIFETEGDTLAHAFKSDYGNYSDGFRKAFHHETISYYRRTDREYVDIEQPSLSAVLSGTPNQVSALIPNAENGLFSRFIFYFMNLKPLWKDVWAENNSEGLDAYFDGLGQEFLELFKILSSGPEIEFSLTREQRAEFNRYFSQVQDKYLILQGQGYMATVRRLGLIAFRICMIFSALRVLETGESDTKLTCEERDFQSALAIINVIVQHASSVFSQLPEEPTPMKRKNRKEKFLSALPKYFSRKEYAAIAEGLSIPDKTAQGYITKFCEKGLVHREQNGSYFNPSAS